MTISASLNDKEAILFVDIGSTLIKAAQAVKTDSGAACTALAVENIIERKDLNASDIAQIIKKLAAASGISASNAVFVLSGSEVTIKHVDFPKMPEEALAKNIKNDMKKEHGEQADKYSCHYRILKEFEAKSDDGVLQKKMRVLLCTAGRQSVDKIKEAAKLAGVNISSIISAQLGYYALAKKMGVLHDLLQDEVIMFLDFGNSQITTNFISNDGLRFSKDINMGGLTLTTVIKSLSASGPPISLAGAEELKFKTGIMSQEAVDALDDSDPEANLHKVLNVSFRKLLQRIRLSTGYFFAHFKESVSFQALKAIYVAGGNGAIKGVKDFLADYYGAGIVEIDCRQAVDMSACRAEDIEKYGASFVNICSAIHEFFYPEYFLNFYQDAKTDAQNRLAGSFAASEFIGGNAAVKYALKFGTVNVVSAFILLYMVIFSALWSWSYWNIAAAESAKKEISALTKELESGEARKKREIIENDYNQYLKKINSKEVIEFKKYSIDKIMLKISDCIPNDVSIKSLDFVNETAPLISIAGTTNSYESAINFSEALKKGENAPDVRVKKIDQLENRVEFLFEIALNGEARK